MTYEKAITGVMRPSNPLALGIDLGGSNLRLGIVDCHGSMVDFYARPIDLGLTGDEIVAMVSRHARDFPHVDEASGVGLALSASILDGGELRPGMTTHPKLGGFPLRQQLAEALGKPCLIDNDANLALVGEAHFGAARGLRDVLLLTLGTGVGGGLMLAGHIRRGAHSSAAEIGLTQVPRTDARGYFSLESLSSPGALMRELGEPRGQLFDRAASGDRKASALIEQMYEYLGMAVTNAHVLLDLELVLLAGGLSRSGVVLRDGLRSAFAKICPPELQLGLRIELAALAPDEGGVIGAACMWFEEQGSLPRL